MLVCINLSLVVANSFNTTECMLSSRGPDFNQNVVPFSLKLIGM